MPLSRTRIRLLDRLRHRKTRARERAYLAEGVRCVTAVLDAGADMRFAAASPRLLDVPGGSDLAARLRDAGIESVAIDDRTLNGLSATETPQGIVAVCAEPQVRLEQPQRLLIADAVQDPGNLGTLIRSAAAFGIDGVIALEGTVDPYNPKVVRASVGAIAGIAVMKSTWTDLKPELSRWKSHLLVAAGEAGRPPEPDARRWALVIGNEARGVRDDIRSVADARIAVPMPGAVDSLNAGIAGSILMYALTQPIRESTDEG